MKKLKLFNPIIFLFILFLLGFQQIFSQKSSWSQVAIFERMGKVKSADS